MNVFGRRGGGGGMRAAPRRQQKSEGAAEGWDVSPPEEEIGDVDLGMPGGRFGRMRAPEFSVIALPDGFVVHQYPEGHLHVVKSPSGPEDVWFYRDGESHDAWKELTAEVWEVRRVKAEAKEAATVVDAVSDVARAVTKVVAPVASPPPVKAPPFPAPKPRVPALDAKPKRKVPWGVLAFIAAIGAVAVLGGGKKKSRSGGGEEA
jgi:hypothetical protein